MSLDKKYLEFSEVVKKHNQSHLLTFYEDLSETEQQRLLEDIESLDFEQIPEWIDKYVIHEYIPPIPDHFDPAPYYNPSDQNSKLTEARKLGEKLIAENKTAAFVVAGGQGTRLGFDGPKGNYPTSPIKNKTLFQIFAESILAVSKKFNATIPWYIMTSELNYDATCEIFKANHYYGLDASNVMIFKQGTLPNFGFDGKILLAEKSRIAVSPDGHGGSLKALYQSGAVADMQTRGVEYLSYFQVDNPLVSVIDPLFIGLHAMDQAEMSSKALIKAYPTEKVGNFCLVDKKVTVIEYSDLPDEFANKKNPDGSLVFELGSIAIHIISRSFIERLNSKGFALPIHRAVKKIPHIDQEGNPVKPQEPNGVKLETFVFDAIPLASESIIVQTEREQEFAPVKNATGTDSAEVTRAMMSERAAMWLESAGIPVPRKSDGTLDCILEMAPSFAVYQEDVKEKTDTVGTIKPGDTLYLD